MLSFKDWLNRLDPAATYENSRPRAWAVAYPTWLLLVALGAWIPGSSAAIGLDPRPVLWVMGLHVLLAVSYFFIIQRERVSPRAGVLLVIGGAVLQVGLAAMMARSRPLGVALFGSLLFLTAFVHGRMLVVTLDAPWGLLGPLASAAAGLLLGSGTENVTLFCAFGLTTTWVALQGGTMAHASAEAVARERQLEQALAAQQLERQQAATRVLERRVVDLLGANHDIKNVLSTAILNAASLRKELACAPHPDPVLLEKADKVQQALALVVAISRTSREAATSEARPTEPVPLAPTLEAVRARMAARWPGCTVSLPQADESLVLPGGGASLERILENLLVNAAEGDGRRGAKRVEVSAFAHGPWLRLTVEDDGPGFAPGQLAEEGAATCQSTKRQGMGLGLVTVASLVAAARGELARTNRPGGGARVEVVLPRADPSRLTAAAP
jgi:signal transduction histidine kinase